MSLDRLKQSIAAVVDSLVGRRLDYQALYPCTVVVQDALERLELLADDERVRGAGIVAVPIRHGLPGVTVKVAPGARVLLGFEAGDPTRPYAALWDPSSLVEVKVTASALARVEAPVVELATTPRLAVARQTDPVQAGPFAGSILLGSLKTSSG